METIYRVFISVMCVGYLFLRFSFVLFIIAAFVDSGYHHVELHAASSLLFVYYVLHTRIIFITIMFVCHVSFVIFRLSNSVYHVPYVVAWPF
jgi:hypothetical protein